MSNLRTVEARDVAQYIARDRIALWKKHYSCTMSDNLCHILESRVPVITHLQLLGGSPSHHKVLKKFKRTSHLDARALLSDFLRIDGCTQIGLLGY